jgi:hypothetical protein
MDASIFGSFEEPRARHHHRAGGDQAKIPQLSKSSYTGLAHANIVGVNDCYPIIRGKAQPAQNRVRLHGFISLKKVIGQSVNQ